MYIELNVLKKKIARCYACTNLSCRRSTTVVRYFNDPIKDVPNLYIHRQKLLSHATWLDAFALCLAKIAVVSVSSGKTR